MKLTLYSPDKKNAWDDFVRKAKNGLFMFERNYMDYHADRFEDHSLMAFDEHGKLQAVLPANKKDSTLFSHQGLTFGGFISGTEMKAALMLQIFDALKSYLADNGFEKVVYKAVPYIYHQNAAEEDIYALFRNQAKLIRLDISSVITMDKRIEFSELRKRGIKKAIKNEIEIIESRNFASFITMLTEVLQARHGLNPVHSIEEIELLAARFPDNIKLHIAQKQGVIVAGILIFDYQQVAHAQYIASSPAGQSMGALDALFDDLIGNKYAGKKYFSFGVSSEEAGQVLNEGLISQKEGFGGRSIVHEFFEMTA